MVWPSRFSAGLEPAARCHCKHRVRRQRQAPARCEIRASDEMPSEPEHALEICVPRSSRPKCSLVTAPSRLFSRRSRAALLFPTTRLPIGRGVIPRLVAASRLDEGACVILALGSLAGASSRSDGGSAHHLTFGRVPNGDRAAQETGLVRRPLLADWLRGTPCLF